MAGLNSEHSAAKPPPEIAPVAHTALLAGLIVAVALTGTLLVRHTPAGAAAPASPPPTLPRAVAYLPNIVVSWALVGYVSLLGRRRNALGSLVGALPRTAWALVRDLATALLLWFAIEGLAFAFAHLPGAVTHAAVLSASPQTALDRVAWVAFALSVGFGEEVVYRGYFQAQLAAFTRSRTLGIAAQALLFAIAHADQGLRGAAAMLVYGTLLGVVASVRGSLVPGILAHVAVDLTAGLLAR